MSNSTSIGIGPQTHLLPPPIPERGKRVVLVDSDGLFHIIGEAMIQPPDKLFVPIYGVEEPPVEFGLVKVTPRSFIFHEIQPLKSGKFNETFNKDQV